MDKIEIFDTTLRDGEQAPGFSMSTREKVRFAHMLEELNVDVIEAGFPVASPGEFEAVRAVASAVTRTRVAALSRTRQQDLETALRALEPARRPRLHIFLATSDLHLEHKLHLTQNQALEQLSEAVRFARARCDEVEFSSEDASRTDIGFLCEVALAAAQSGATSVSFADTVGHSMPSEYATIFERVHTHLADHPNLVLSAHCHDDLGLAVANSLAAVSRGARQIHCTINGIGERAGNAALEELVMAIDVRRQYFDLETQIRLEHLYLASQLLTAITGISVPPNKAVVGRNAFSHEAGIHQDGILKNKLTYQIFEPERVGAPARRLVLGKHSGRNALHNRMQELGHEVSQEELEGCYNSLLEKADNDEEIEDADLLSVLQEIRMVTGTG